MKEEDKEKVAKAFQPKITLFTKLMLLLGIAGTVGVTSNAFIGAHLGERPDNFQSIGAAILWYAWIVACVFRIQNRNMILGSIIGAVLGFFIIFGATFYAVNRIDDETWAVHVWMSTNADLPKMMSDDTRLDSVSASKELKTVTYNITFINFDAAKAKDLEPFTKSFMKTSRPAMCSDSSLKSFLDWGYKIKIIYRDKLERIVAEDDLRAFHCFL